MTLRMKTFLSFLFVLTASFSFAAHHEGDGAHSAKADAYPLTTCLVSGEPLGGMGEPYVLMHKAAGKPDREVRFCCEMCVSRFNSDPAKYLAKLHAAAMGSADATAAGTESMACCASGPCAKCAAAKTESHAHN